jgi:Phosphopantetheine attachment site
MVIIMPQDTVPLPKSSKGTILRNIAYDRFSKPIEEAYRKGDAFDGVGTLGQTPSHQEVLKAVRQIVHTVTGEKGALHDGSDFYHHGIDSSMCAQIRGRLQRVIGRDYKLPWSVVYDCGSITA